MKVMYNGMILEMKGFLIENDYSVLIVGLADNVTQAIEIDKISAVEFKGEFMTVTEALNAGLWRELLKRYEKPENKLKRLEKFLHSRRLHPDYIYVCTNEDCTQDTSIENQCERNVDYRNGCEEENGRTIYHWRVLR